MEIKISCPYCGKNLTYNFKTRKKIEIICELCGSPLDDEVAEALKNYKPPKNQQNSDFNVNNASVNRVNYENSQNFPSPTEDRPNKRIVPNMKFPFGMGASKASPIKDNSKSDASLSFPQIQQKIIFPASQAIFHFGRNIILPLVSPASFDIVWLNSISRIQKQNHKVIRSHFQIRRDNSGNYFIEDKNSRWGTWLNKQQIKNKGEIQIFSGDKIELMLSKPNTSNIFPFEIIFQI